MRGQSTVDLNGTEDAKKLSMMDNQKYLVIITLLDGQNFAVPSGATDRIEATVFAEARFGNESVLRSDPIRLTNSNPEFSTELAWQLDKKTLHQLRVERKAIKLQVFLQTRERKRNARLSETNPKTIEDGKPNETHKIELIGYTILDLRSAQEIERPKSNHFRWYPLLNPKFRKSSYNRPEIQLAITLGRLGGDPGQNDSNQFSSISSLPDDAQGNESLEFISNQSDSHEHNHNNDSSKLYTTCLDVTVNSDILVRDEIIDNDIIVEHLEGVVYIYDAANQKSSRKDCNEKSRLVVTIPYCNGLDVLLGHDQVKDYYYSINLFGSTYKILGSDQPREVVINLMTTNQAALATYFELYSNLDIKLHRANGESVGISTIQLNQLCSLDLKCRSIEGIFSLQSPNEQETRHQDATNPSIGVSVALEKASSEIKSQYNAVDDSECHINGQYSGDSLEDQIISLINDTHQVTFDDSTKAKNNHEILLEEHNPGEDDHHYCFTIDLKKFSYTPSQRLIPLLRELVISYSYYWFGYVEKITTDASIPINATSSIIVAGFCEFNFASSSGPLLTALSEIPLDLEILAVDEVRLKGLENERNHERLVATCSINLADILGLNAGNINHLGPDGLSKTTSVPIYALDGQTIGELQIYLCLRDLGKPTKKSLDGSSGSDSRIKERTLAINEFGPSTEMIRLEGFMAETKKNLETWTEENLNKLADELRRRDLDKIKKISQRIEAKEAMRDMEFKKKLEDLNNLERKFLASLANIDCLEKMLSESIEHLKNKNTDLDSRVNRLEQKISQKTCNGQTNHPLPEPKAHDDHALVTKNEVKTIPYWARNVQVSPRRVNPAGCNLPVRSSSLVRAPESSSVASRQVVRRATGPVPTASIKQSVVNSRLRSNSAKISLSRDTLEKLTSARRDKVQPR